tara:strand:- start:182 stop:394 length:213 start_codon:yes stop_codon:yes gene_type:complete
MKTTKINKGIYKITNGSRTFEANKSEDGQWQLLELIDNSEVGMPDSYEYIDHWLDFRSCKIWVEYHSNIS